MTTPYIPNTDAGFAAWLQNFAGLIQANPATYGLLPADADLISDQESLFADAYTLATDPSSRTAPAVAAKDAVRSAAEAVVRPYAMAINADISVSDASRSALGLTIRIVVGTPIPAPTTEPTLELRRLGPGTIRIGYADASGAVGKSKPPGSIGVEVYAGYGVAPIIDPALTTYVGTITKSPFTLPSPASERGQTATYFARFVTLSGPAGRSQVGPWSAGLTSVVT